MPSQSDTDNSPMIGKTDALIKKMIGFISTESGVLKKRAPSLIDLFLIGSLLTLGLYYLCLFGLIRNEMSALYFGCLSVLTAFLYMMSTENFFISLFPNFNWEITAKIEYISIYVGFTIFIMLINSLYPKEFSQVLLRVTQSLGVLFTLTALFINPEMQIYGIMAYGGIVVVFSIYLIYVFIRAVLEKEKGPYCFLSGFFSLLL
jgi:hypothetical protein